jgi:nucleotidyltransferase/DNA polymerase involved in DNA repair
VISLLPEGHNTLGSVASHLSLPELMQALDAKTGRLVFDLCQGVDHEPVKETVGALTKSITAFKSFQKTEANGVLKWIQLLASDIVNRVELDSARNQRTPRLCNIQYTGPGKMVCFPKRV